MKKIIIWIFIIFCIQILTAETILQTYNFEIPEFISKDGYTVVEGVFAINSNCEPVTKEVTLNSENEVCCDGVLTVTALNPQNQPIAGAIVKLWKNGSVIILKDNDTFNKTDERKVAPWEKHIK